MIQQYYKKTSNFCTALQYMQTLAKNIPTSSPQLSSATFCPDDINGKRSRRRPSPVILSCFIIYSILLHIMSVQLSSFMSLCTRLKRELIKDKDESATCADDKHWTKTAVRQSCDWLPGSACKQTTHSDRRPLHAPYARPTVAVTPSPAAHLPILTEDMAIWKRQRITGV